MTALEAYREMREWCEMRRDAAQARFQRSNSDADYWEMSAFDRAFEHADIRVATLSVEKAA